MKLEKQLYNILQYLSTIDDILAYNGNQLLVQKSKVGSDFVEVDVPTFFKEKIVIFSLSKFLRLFSFGKGKNESNESIQDWILSQEISPTNNAMGVMFINSPGKTVRLLQGAGGFLEKRAHYCKPKFDNIKLERSIKFQITQQTYKQILTDCSLLDLDTITIVSETPTKIRIYLTKKDKGLTDNYTTYEIDCEHEHQDLKISFTLQSFNLIEATDHQLEYGMFITPTGGENMLLKVRSFCDNNYIVKKLIIGLKGVKL